MKISDIEALGQTTTADIVNLFVGEMLGKGCYREVYECLIDQGKVVKIEISSQSFRNVHEWEIWRNCPKEWKKWLAPCYSISPCGIALVQAKVDKVIKRPVRIPDFLDDLQHDNWGLFENRVVMCDYGHHRFFENGFRRAKLRKTRGQWQKT